MVVGAGLAGLIAARQLKYFGFNVILVEGRNRMGGRVFTYRLDDECIFDMGPQFVEGTSKKFQKNKQFSTIFSRKSIDNASQPTRHSSSTHQI